ncbi:GspE3 [Desulforapulum autotrophicum HRM2]|uniref:protein-secreting ATPase n=1 Tax=Desulforapulum autotrophicum (strain ATCC 43914 / DSM 3382 / VKM B-1955 / HRM2) TaxID=177437 RepID=C0QK83_DESAH|nr:type II secretion system ATPase GspE [Desulforapulum autotrophicum]ACN16109.1 GspE3 [Desulforapulum autotrophicum HRM2]
MTKKPIESVSYNDFPKEPVPLENLSVKFMKQSVFVPLALENNTLKIAIADPHDSYTIDALKLSYSFDVEVFQASKEEIFDAFERLYGSGSQSIETIIEEAHRDVHELNIGEEEGAENLKDLASEAPIIRLVNRLIVNAVEIKASDIHFEPFETFFRIRYRIDGVLHEIEKPPVRLQSAIISRVKIMAKLDIAERRLPQDGNIKLKISDREIDFRVSTIPTLYGESLVMRVLDRESLAFDFQELGFPEDIYSRYMDLVKQPYGMILVTGPTGSGKTSTLYTTLAVINSTEQKVITLEDPVEYQLPGVNQIQVKPKIGLTFANGLRSIVRQDPDIILVGEIRDSETAEIAIQSALTGHLLFSTLHTNDSAGAIARLLDMGVEHFLLSSTLLGVLAQRLVRVICPHCKTVAHPEQRLLDLVRLSPEELSETVFYEGKGCEACHYTGFKGRKAIFEYLAVDAAIRREIVNKSSADEIKRVAVNSGLRTLRQDGWEKVKAGMTTISEVLRVTLEG